MKIRYYLVLMAAAILVPVTAFSAFAIDLLQEAQRAAVMRALHEGARATALAVDRELMSSEAALRVLGGSPTLAVGDLRGFYAQAKLADRGPDAWTVLFDSRGKQLLNTVLPYGSSLPAPTAAQRVAKVMAERKTLVSGVLTGAVTQKRVTAINVPVPIADGHKYVLAQTYDGGHFGQVVAGQRMPPSWIVSIIDRSGVYIARSKGAAQFVGRHTRPELMQAAATTAEGEFRLLTMDDVEADGVFTHVATSGWIIAVAAPVAVTDAAKHRALLLMTLGMSAAIALATVAAAYYGRRLTYAIGHASAAAATLGEGKTPVSRRYGVAEIDALHSALHNVGAVLSYERTSRQQAQTEREKLFESEKKARLLAEEQSKAKDEFLAMLGHELRNPLSAISAGIEVAKRAATLAGAAKAHEIIDRQSSHLGRIVDDLLDTGRMFAGKITLVRCPVDLANAVQACMAALDASGRLNQHPVQVKTVATWVTADPARIDQMFNNLMVNALKYTPPGRSIGVDVRPEGARAVMRINDAGIGIPAELAARIFEPFVQGQSSIDRAQGGLGIGLTMVRELVRLHGGNVRVESSGEGQGSIFTVELPLTARPAAAPLDVEAPQPTARYRLLLVEDNADAREATVEMLRILGYEITAASNGLEGLRLAKSMLPGVVVVDIGLPDISGYELAERLRQDAQTARVGLIALTGYGLATDVRRAVEAGFDAHLTKPINARRLVEAVERVAACKAAR